MKTTLLRLCTLLIVFSMMVSPVYAMGSAPDMMIMEATEQDDVPVLSSPDLTGDYTVGMPGQFLVNLTNPTTESYEVVVYFEITAAAGDIASLEFLYDVVEGVPQWAPLDLQPSGDTLAGMYGPDSGGLPIGPGFDETVPFRITFAKAGVYPATMVLLDVSTGTPLELNTLSGTLTAHNPPEISLYQLSRQQPVDVMQEFGVSVNNQNTFAYENVTFKFEITAQMGDISLLQTIDPNTGKWVNLPYLQQGNMLVGYFGEPRTWPAQTPGSTGLHLAFAKPGVYPLTLKMITVEGETETVINSLSTTITVYDPPPLLSAIDLNPQQKVNTMMEFGIGITHTADVDLENVTFKFEVVAKPGDITLLQTFDPNTGKWVDLPFLQQGDMLVGYFVEPMTWPGEMSGSAGFHLTFAKPGNYPMAVKMIAVNDNEEMVISSLSTTITVDMYKVFLPFTRK